MKNKINNSLYDLSNNGKQCSCGKWYYHIPLRAKYHSDGFVSGFWWNCVCKSTLLKVVK